MTFFDNVIIGGNKRNSKKNPVRYNAEEDVFKEEFGEEIFDDEMYFSKDKDGSFDEEVSEELRVNEMHPTKNESNSFDEEVGKEIIVDEKSLSNDVDRSFSEEFGEEINVSSDGSFNEEFSDVIATNVSPLGVQSYSKAGVTFEKLSETQARINYNGLLAKSGGQNIIGVYGFGSNQNWEKVSEADMKQDGAGAFSAIIPIEQGKNVNLCFKDNVGNWDNNTSMNYTFVN